MNDIDAKNIRRILEWRRQKPFFEVGGIFSEEELDKVTTAELENWLKGSEDGHKPKFKALVDAFFEKYGKEGDNIILLTSANNYGSGATLVDYDEDTPWWSGEYSIINFDGFNHEYNKLFYPVQIGEDDEEGKTMWEEIVELSSMVGITDAETYWTEESDDVALNEMWYGVIGIMKDYKAVAFVIRDDGMLCDEEGIDEGENAILVDLA